MVGRGKQLHMSRRKHGNCRQQSVSDDTVHNKRLVIKMPDGLKYFMSKKVISLNLIFISKVEEGGCSRPYTVTLLKELKAMLSIKSAKEE